MDLFVTTAWAQDAGAASGSAWMQLLPLVLIFVVFYFLLIRPQQKRAKQHRELVESLKTGDSVVTAGGIHGKVTAVQEGVVTLEVATGVKIKVNRTAIVSTKQE